MPRTPAPTLLPERLDCSDLRRRVPWRTVRATARELRESGRLRGLRRRSRTTVGVLIGCFALFVLLGLVVVAALSGDPDQPTAATVFGVCALVIVAAAGFAGVDRYRRERRWPRLERFARRNGLTYLPAIAEPSAPGMIFHVGIQRIAFDVIRTRGPRAVELGNVSCNALAQNRRLTEWGYVGIRLPAPLPNIVLAAARGSTLPAVLDPAQRLGLEGDFDRHFTLYCPREYERDALYLFTPDVMVRFLDHAGGWEVEIVDDWMFLYRSREAVTLDPAAWSAIAGTVEALAEKTTRWGRWREEHQLPVLAAGVRPVVVPGSAAVAPGGRRLVGWRVLYVAGTIVAIAMAVLIPRLVAILVH